MKHLLIQYTQHVVEFKATFQIMHINLLIKFGRQSKIL